MDAKLARLMIALFERTGGLNRWDRKHRVYHRIRSLHGANATVLTKLFFARMFAGVLAVNAGTVALFLLTGDSAMWLLGCIGIGLACFYPFKALDRRLQLRNRQILMELPVFINRWLLRIGAGESLPNAIRQSCAAANRLDHPLYQEFARLFARIDNGKPFAAALEEASAQLGLPEFSRLVQLVLMHYRKGGDDLFHELRMMLGQLWETRKQTVRKLGEEASSKMVFPMVIVFFALMLLVASPILFFTT